MKKLCATLLAAAMLFSFAACTVGTQSAGSGMSSNGSSASADVSANISENTSAAVDFSASVQESDSSDVTATDEPDSSAAGLIGLMSGSDEICENDAESYRILCTVSKPALYLKDEDAYPELAKSLKALNDSFESDAETMRDELLSSAKEYEQDSDSPQLYCYTTLNPLRADSKVLSILSYSRSYSGGVHGYYSFSGFNYDPSTGEELTLDDVLIDVSVLSTELEKRLTEKYPDASFFNLSDSMEELASSGEYNWTLGYDNITFYFNPYDIATYADGLLSVTIGFSENPEMFNSEYTTAPTAYSQALLMDFTQYIDVDGDGKLDSVSVSADRDEYDTYTNLKISINGVTYTEDVYSLAYEFYLVHAAGGKVYLVANGKMENDYQNLRIFDLSGDEVTMTDDVEGSGLLNTVDVSASADDIYNSNVIRNELLTDPTNFLTGTRCNMLSTCTVRASNRITDDGKLEMLTDYYEMDNTTNIVLTSKVDLTLTVPDDGSEVTIPAGTKFSIYRTDNSNYVDLKLNDGRVCRVDVDASGWPILVNGTNAEEVFDGMVFAG